jgi:ubiquinone/menaquinone biosynthesis C-methylase UbiE
MDAEATGACAGMNEAAAWAALYDDPALAGRGFVFRRSVELACEACREWADGGQTWIDAGSGPGHLARELAALGPRVIAVDADAAALAWARQRETDSVKGRNAPRFIRSSVTRFPLTEGCVDGVAGASLAGCLTDLEGFLRESRRVLRPGGHLVLTATNAASLLLRVNNVLRRMEYHRARSAAEQRRYRLYDPGEMIAALRASGFEPIRLRFFNYVLNAGPWLLPASSVAVRFDCDAALSEGASRMARNFLVAAERT